ELLDAAPALARALLEEAHGVAVAVGEIAQLRLLDRRGDGDAAGPCGQVTPHPERDDGAGVVHLVGREAHVLAEGGGAALLAADEEAQPVPFGPCPGAAGDEAERHDSRDDPWPRRPWSGVAGPVVLGHLRCWCAGRR